MSLLLAMWHALPGWTWGGGGVAIVVLVALAIFAPALFANVLASAGKLVALVPWGKWQTWALIGAAVAIAAGKVALDMHDQALAAAAADHEAKAVAAERATWQAREKASNDAYAARLASLQAWIDAQAASQAAAAKALADQVARERAARTKAEDALDMERGRNVTVEANARCALTRGVVLQFNGGASLANGGDELAVAAAAAAAGISPSAASGVALDTYARAVEGTQRALRSCRDQVTGWQRYHAEVIGPWIATAIEAVNRCTPPAGASP